MHGSFQNEEEEEVARSIELTNKLGQSLRRLLTKRKVDDSQRLSEGLLASGQQSEHLLNKISFLEEINQELSLDNQHLSSQLIRVKEELQECNKKLKEMSRYVEFMQSYNDGMKKQLNFWVNNQRKAPAQESISTLINKVMKLRKENQLRQEQLNSLEFEHECKAKESHFYDNGLLKFQNEAIKHKTSRENQRNQLISFMNEREATPKRQLQQKRMKSQRSHSSKGKPKEERGSQRSSLMKWHHQYIPQS